MKKTLIALLALASVAMADTTIDPSKVITYVPTFDGGSTTQTNVNKAITFGTDAGTQLKSWIFEFSVTNPGSGPNKAPFSTNGTTSPNTGLSLVFWKPNTARDFGIGTQKQDSTYNTYSVSLSHDFASSSPLTLRLAYDAQNDTAYLYKVGTTDGIIQATGLVNNVAQVSHLYMTSGVSTMRAFGETMELMNLYDMTNAAIQGVEGSAAFKSFVMNPSVPEPMTGTLSLLALAGLCIRRRK